MTRKTEIAFALNEHPGFVGKKKYRYHSPIVSAEWCALTNFPWGRGLINFEEHEETMALETYRTWMKLFELQMYYSWTVDRFHISTQLVQSRLGRNYNFNWLEKRLRKLGFCIIFCTRSNDSFAEAREKRLRVTGNAGQYEDLDIFVEEQKEYHKLISGSLLPSFEIDVTGDDIEYACGSIVEWLAGKKLLGYYE